MTRKSPGLVSDSQRRIVPDSVVKELYRKMLGVYYIEERLKILTRQGKVSFHASTRGHEKVQVGTVMLMKPGHDWFFPYYREKAIVYALGVPAKDIFLHMLSREGDPSSNGRNMPEHFSSRELHIVSPTACTGTQFLPAVGLAKALRKDGSNAIVYVSSGEGATSEGEFFESLNWATREELPVLFLIQNNGYAISVPQNCQTVSEVHRMAQGFGLPTYHVDGTWYEGPYQTLPPLIEKMRNGGGPVLIEAQVVRLEAHSSSDDQLKYRSEEEMAKARERDPILLTEKYLLRNNISTEKEIEALRAEIRSEIDRAADEADSAPQPEAGHITEKIYSDNKPVFEEKEPTYISEDTISMVEAINRGLREEMERNPKIVMWGEDIADPKGGVFGVTRGLTNLYPDRVQNSPLAEASIVGVAGGMAIGGYKPIVEIQFADYSWPGFMQMRNEIPTVRWRSYGAWSNPMVVRIASGGRIKGGPFHSACPEAIYAHTPGWYIVFPSNAEDAKGLIKTAARCEDPVLFLEHKRLYRHITSKSREPNADYLIPFGKGKIKREGNAATIVTWGATVYTALEIAEEFDLEVIDLRSIVPMDDEMVYRSVRKTNRALVLHEDSITLGWGAEVVARIASNCFEYLDAPVLRVGAKDSFVPSAVSLEDETLPSVDDLRQAVTKLLEY
ncbi:MAG: tungsten formylmethanofuran dehydrogenase [Acidobacteria bacterium]|nr:tungsten formylmethanofuran dehydrogenase [Acidobacteriota bacterium]